MTTFNDREKAFEAKYAQDAEMTFKAIARRDKALAHWAAGLLGKTAEQTRVYEATLVREEVVDFLVVFFLETFLVVFLTTFFLVTFFLAM